MKLIPLAYRDKALQELKDKFYDLLKREHGRRKLVFKAPTGSGKTVAMACFLRDVVNELPNRFDLQNKNIAWIWIAPNELHIQSYDSLSHFYSETRDIRTINFEDITDDCLHPNEMLFLNWQSINRDENVFIRENEQGKNLYSYLANTRLNDTEIIVIIDEEHLMGQGATAEKSEYALKQIQGKIEIRVSATPKTPNPDGLVVVAREDVVKEQMIKKGVHLNPLVRADEQQGRDADLVLLEKALAKRDELAEKYAAQGTNINPLLLIQLPSDTKKITQDDTRIRDLVVDALTARQKPITVDNGKLGIWLSGEKEHLKDISKPDNMVEAMLFKQAISLGWDCPRAAVILIYREHKNETFTVQTLGRILRMPEQKHYNDEELNYGYVYTNLNKDLITILPEETDYISQNRADRNDKIYNHLALKSFYIQSEIKRNRIGLHFREALFRAAEKMFSISIDPTGPESFYEQNRNKMRERGVEMNVENIEIPIPTDVKLDVTEVGATRADHIEKFAKTTYQLEQLFNRFCLSSCGEYQKDGSWERIKYHTKLLFEEYFGLWENICYKVVLYNHQKFTDLFNLAREFYAEIMAAKAKSKSSEVKENPDPWEVPPFRIYNDKYKKYPAERHILEPLFARERELQKYFDSANEARFIDFLEQHKPNIKWWYKNGASSREDFAIPYKKKNGSDSLFYVDIVIQFSNGTLGLFDPKTIESDPENINKHNALIEFIEKRNEKKKPTIGGIILPKQGSWHFCRNRIANDSDLTGWDIFNPANIAVNETVQ